jgi:hypothetical protein
MGTHSLNHPRIYTAERIISPSHCACPRSVYYPWATRPVNPDCIKHGEKDQ